MKPFWLSKTLWFNVLAVAGAALDPGGAFSHVLAPEETATIIGVGNIILRLLTSKGIVK